MSKKIPLSLDQVCQMLANLPGQPQGRWSRLSNHIDNDFKTVYEAAELQRRRVAALREEWWRVEITAMVPAASHHRGYGMSVRASKEFFDDEVAPYLMP